MKTVQYLDAAYLERCRNMSADDILQFLDDFQRLHSPAPAAMPTKSKLISLKLPQDLLSTFRQQCDQKGLRYQTQIKQLMTDWVKR
jgi:predicted DNA binding CopG/RHH family protein